MEVLHAATMNFYGAENRDEHTLAGRLIPLAEALYRSVLKAGSQPVPESKYSAQLPAWCHHICDQLTKSIFRGLVDVAPKDRKFDARHYGRMVGLLLRGASFWFKDAPAQLKQEGLLDLSPEQEQKLEKSAGLELLLPVASEQFQKPVTNEEELLDAGQAQLEAKAAQLMSQGLVIMKFLVNQPVAEQHKFLCGIPEGFVMVLDNQAEFTSKRGRYEIFILLLGHWPEIVEMQKVQPPKTRRDLLEWLEQQEGRQLFEDPKVFYELCGDTSSVALPRDDISSTTPANASATARWGRMLKGIGPTSAVVKTATWPDASEAYHS
jgi:hypothetical protein